jgi:hypothetical protein
LNDNLTLKWVERADASPRGMYKGRHASLTYNINVIRGFGSFLSPNPAELPSEQSKTLRGYLDELDLMMEDVSEIADDAMDLIRDIREELSRID